MGRIVDWLRRERGIGGYAACVVGFMVVVILEGAVVRATGSGAGCGNHWPLCNGDVIPHHPRIATMIEFLHRSLTGICTWLVIGLIAWVFLARPKGDITRKAVIWTGILLLTEGALGAVLVKGGYVEKNASNMRVLVQCIHFSNTMMLLAAMTLTWWWLGQSRVTTLFGSPRQKNGRLEGIAAWMALVATLVVGATGSVAALADTLFPATDLRVALAQDFAATAPLLVRMRWLHPAASVLALACAVWVSYRVRSTATRWVMGLIAVQIVLGVADVLLLAPTWMQVLHLLGADLYWIALVAACSGLLVPEGRRLRKLVPVAGIV